MRMKNILIICFIMLITLPTGQGRRIKRKFVDFGIGVSSIYIASFTITTIKGIYKNYRYAKDYKKMYDALVDEVNQKKDYMKQSIDRCRNFLPIKDYILTTINKILAASFAHENNEGEHEHCSQVINKLSLGVKEQADQNNEEEKKKNLECIKNQLKNDTKSILGDFLKLMGTETESSFESEIFPFFDVFNDSIIKKKQMLTELKGKLKDSLNLFTLWRTDYEKMAENLNFGSDRVPDQITESTGLSFMKSWMKVASGAATTIAANVASFTLGTASTPQIIAVFAVDLINFTFNVVASNTGLLQLIKKLSFSSLISSALKHSVLLDNGMVDISIEKESFINYLKKNLILTNIQKFGKIPKKLEKSKGFESLENQIDSIDNADSSIKYRQMVTNKLRKGDDYVQPKFGLYFTEVSIAYSLEDVRLFRKNGFELISWINWPKEGEFFLLGKRFEDSPKVLLYVELFYFDIVSIKPEEIGSDHKTFLSHKFKPLMRNKLIKYYSSYCGEVRSVSEIHNLVNMSEIDVKITKTYFVVSLMIDRSFYDKEENKKYVNCFNKYKKLDDLGHLDSFSVCTRDMDNILHLCQKSEISLQKIELLTDEIKDLIRPDNVYNFFKNEFKIDQEFMGNGLVGKKTLKETKILYHAKLVDFSKNKDEEIPKIICEEIKKFDFRKEAIKVFYGDIWAYEENIKKYVNSKAKQPKKYVKGEIINSLFKKMKMPWKRSYNKPIKYKNLLISNEQQKKYISFIDYYQIFMNKKVEITEENQIRLSGNNNFFETPFEQIFSGFYAINENCKPFSNLIKNAYVSPLLKQDIWKNKNMFVKAFKHGKTESKQEPFVSDLSYFNALGKVFLNFEQINDEDRTLKNFGNTLIKDFEDYLSGLKDCKFASLAYEFKLKNKNLTNPKIAVYPSETDIQVEIIENSDEELIYSNEGAVTFTLVDVKEITNKNSDLNKFQPIENAERKYYTFGYKKVEDFYGESDFKVYFEDKSKYIIINVWNKLDLNKINENTKAVKDECIPIKHNNRKITFLNKDTLDTTTKKPNLKIKRSNSYNRKNKSIRDEEESDESMESNSCSKEMRVIDEFLKTTLEEEEAYFQENILHDKDSSEDEKQNLNLSSSNQKPGRAEEVGLPKNSQGRR